MFIYSIFFNFCQKGDSPANGEVYLNIREKKKNSCAKWNNRLLRWSGLFLYGHPFPLRALIFGETLTGQLKETHIININKYNSQTNGNVPALAAVYIALKISSVYVLAHTHIFPHSHGFLFFFMWWNLSRTVIWRAHALPPFSLPLSQASSLFVGYCGLTTVYCRAM